MDYYEFLSEVTGVDADYMKKRSDILKFRITDVVMFLETFHEKLNEGIVNEANRIKI